MRPQTIYTVTLNPTMDITYILEEIAFNQPVKAVKVMKNPGGKGINVSRALHNMHIQSTAIAMIGGYTGEEIVGYLRGEDLNIQFVKIRQENRTNVIILNRRDSRELIIRSAGPQVSEGEAEQVFRFILDIAKPPGILVLSGSIPPGMRADIYASLIQAAKSRGLLTILDSDGEPLAKGIAAAPFLIKPNRDELERLAGRNFRKIETMVDYCRGLIERGLEIVVVSLGKDGALMVTRDGAWRGKVPLIEREDTVGAGDSMVAGLVMGLIESQPVEQVFRMGLACGLSAVINPGPDLCEPETYSRALEQARICIL